jgi:hypothetical protein
VLVCATDPDILPILPIWPIAESVTYVFSMRLIVGAPGLAFETRDILLFSFSGVGWKEEFLYPKIAIAM